MPLTATLTPSIGDPITLNADELTLDRQLGDSVRLFLQLDLPNDGKHEGILAKALAAGPMRVQGHWPDHSGKPISPDGLIGAARWSETGHKLLVEAVCTLF